MTDLAPTHDFAPLSGNPGSTTAFDDLVGALSVPAELTGGDIPEAVVMDGFVRGRAIVARSRANQAMIGLRVDPAGRDLRLEIELGVDETSWQWWVKRVPEELHDLRPALNRVVEVTVQGAPCGALILSRRASDGGGPTRAVLQVDVPAGRVDPDALLMIELEGRKGGTGDDELLPMGMIGVRVDVVRIELAGDPLASQISGGDTRSAMIRREWAAITPGADGHDLVLELVDDVQLPELVLKRGGRYGRLAARVVRKGAKVGLSTTRSALSRLGRPHDDLVARCLADGRLTVTVTDLRGAAVTAQVTPVAGANRLQVALPQGRTGAVLLRVHLTAAALRSAGYSPQTSWAVLKLG